MGDASPEQRAAGKRLGNWAFGLLTLASGWPLLAVIFLGGGGPWPGAFWLNIAPSLAAAAGVLFFKAARR